MAQGETVEQIAATVSSVAEGVKTSMSVHILAKELGVEMPICKSCEPCYQQQPRPPGLTLATQCP